MTESEYSEERSDLHMMKKSNIEWIMSAIAVCSNQ